MELKRNLTEKYKLREIHQIGMEGIWYYCREIQGSKHWLRNSEHIVLRLTYQHRFRSHIKILGWSCNKISSLAGAYIWFGWIAIRCNKISKHCHEKLCGEIRLIESNPIRTYANVNVNCKDWVWPFFKTQELHSETRGGGLEAIWRFPKIHPKWYREASLN